MTPRPRTYTLVLNDPELSLIHHAVLQLRARARRRMAHNCGRGRRQFDQADAMHRRLLPLRTTRKD